MKLHSILCVLPILWILPERADAFVFDLNAFYYSDSFKVSGTSNETRIFGDVALGLNVDKKGAWIIGWNVGYVSANDQSTSNTTYTVSEMGPKFGYFLDKDRVFGIWATYNLVVNGAYNAGGGVAETWRGSSIKVEVGITPALDTDMFAGVKFIYHSETFNEVLIGATNYSQVAYSRAFIYPALNFSLRY
jgi:hypothetical protein